MLDPLRTGDVVKPGDVFAAYLYGAAGGIGMGLGAEQRPRQRQAATRGAGVLPVLPPPGWAGRPGGWAAMTKGWSKKDFQRMAATDEAQNKGDDGGLLHGRRLPAAGRGQLLHQGSPGASR